MNTIQQNDLAGFWKRPLALATDATLLLIIGYFMANSFSDFFIKFQNIGSLIGFFIAYLYFAVQNSYICNGQTIGKRIFKIQVVDINGNPINFKKASIRYFVLEAPSLLYGMQIFNPSSSPILFWIYIIWISIFFALTLVTIYLYIFNQRTRQSLHDLIVGSYVRRCDVPWSSKKRSINPIHYKIIIGFFVIMIAGIALVNRSANISEADMKELGEIQQIVLKDPNVIYANVGKGTFTYDNTTKKIITVTARYNYKVDLSDKTLSKIANEVLDSDSNIKEDEELRIIIFYGARTGIYSSNITYGQTKTPEEWRKIKATLN